MVRPCGLGLAVVAIVGVAGGTPVLAAPAGAWVFLSGVSTIVWRVEAGSLVDTVRATVEEGVAVALSQGSERLDH